MKKNKSFIMCDSVKYLGHLVDADGIRATPEKVVAIEKLPQPQNITLLRSFLGLLNYYLNFYQT